MILVPPTFTGTDRLCPYPALFRALGDQVEQGQWFLPGEPTHRRETIVTSPLRSIPQYLVIIPGPSWWHVIAAAFTAALFLSLTVKLTLPAALFGVIAIGAMLRWAWELDKGPDHEPVDVGGGLKLPVYMLGNRSHAIWAVWVLIVVIGMIFACMVFSYLYRWSVQPDRWPPAGTTLPSPLHTGTTLLLLAASGGLLTRSAEHTSELQSLMRISYAVFCLKKKKHK